MKGTQKQNQALMLGLEPSGRPCAILSTTLPRELVAGHGREGVMATDQGFIALT